MTVCYQRLLGLVPATAPCQRTHSFMGVSETILHCLGWLFRASWEKALH